MEWRAGDVTGVLPYSRLVNPPGDSVAQEPTEILVVHRDHLPAMIRECHEVTSILVHKMLDRARVFTSSGLHDEKMVSLGKLSAGLAHELNNPASAIERSAALLEDRLEEAELATRALGAARLTDRQLAAIDAVRASCLASAAHGVLSPIQQAEREDAIADWLADHGLERRHRRAAGRNRRHARRARPDCRGGGRTGARRGAPVGGRRLFGARHRVGDPGRRDADLRPGHGHQGIHAHGPGDGGRARGPGVEPGQHRHRAQVEGAGEVGGRRRAASSPASRACAASSAS